MKINNTSLNFKGINLAPLSKGLYTLQNNDMLNAAGIDIVFMDTPRTVIEHKHRGKNAGREMGFREFTGTFIAEFSAALFAFFNSKIFNKIYKPETKINSSSWVTNSNIDVLNEIYQTSNKTPEDFIKNTLNSMEGLAGNKTIQFKNVNSENKNIIKENLTKLITNDKLNKKEVKNILRETQDEIIKILGADNNIKIIKNSKETNANLTHTLRDIVDLGKNVFFKENINIKDALSKLKTMNKARVFSAIPLSMMLAITNQYINRKITKKKTGIDNFVGENNYENNVKSKNQKENQKGLWWKKILSAGVFLLMLSKVMNIKKPQDIINKLEFDGPVTSGNAIKTVYGTLILGRIFASKDTTELRETNVRDYLGFLNWLVFGGFVAKGVAQIFDPKQERLFNITKEGKGLRHWLSDVQIKSQKEIMAQNIDPKAISKNLKQLNIAQLSGIAYSAVMLGVLLPKLNIWMTKKQGNKENNNIKNDTPIFKGISVEDYIKKVKYDKIK